MTRRDAGKAGKGDPGRPAGPASAMADGLLRQAAALRAAGRFGEALAACRRLLAMEPENSAALALGGLLCWSRGDYLQALPLLQKAALLRPKDAEAQSNLGAILQSLGKFDDAVAAYQRAIGLNPTYVKSHGNLGAALLQTGKPEEAIKVFRRALKIDSGYAEAQSGLGVALHKCGSFHAAAKACRRAVALAPQNANTHSNLAAALLAKGAPGEALAACERALALDPGDTRKLSFKAGVLEALGEREALRHLVDFDRLIGRVRSAVPPGYASAAAFNRALADHLAAHRSLQYEPATKATRLGWQSGELLVKPEGPMAALKALIAEAVRGYLAEHPADPAHPFLARKPTAWRLKGWATVLQSQGHQETHTHPIAWLSGVYYVKVPPDMAPDTTEGEQAGWIEFGRPGADFPADLDPEVKLLQPEEGSIFLFPSYFHHRTLPFRSDEKRISFAFDVIAER